MLYLTINDTDFYNKEISLTPMLAKILRETKIRAIIHNSIKNDIN